MEVDFGLVHFILLWLKSLKTWKGFGTSQKHMELIDHWTTTTLFLRLPPLSSVLRLSLSIHVHTYLSPFDFINLFNLPWNKYWYNVEFYLVNHATLLPCLQHPRKTSVLFVFGRHMYMFWIMYHVIDWKFMKF